MAPVAAGPALVGSFLLVALENRPKSGATIKFQYHYRVRRLPEYLGWVDLDLGSSPGWWAATVATYCPSRVVEHAKSKSTQPRYSSTSVNLSSQLEMT